MHKKPAMPPAGEAILAGDLETMRRLAGDGSLLFKKGKTVQLRRDIPRMVGFGGRAICTDAFTFALANGQIEIARMLIGCGLVDLGLGSEALYTAIAGRHFDLLDDLLDHGAQFGREERDITRLLLNLMDQWDEDCPALLQKLNLPIGAHGGKALCYAAGNGNYPVAAYLLDAGVDVDSRDPSLQSTALFQAAAMGHRDIVRLLVERGADVTLRNEFGYRPSTAARANHHGDIVDYLWRLEPEELHRVDTQDALFARFHVPKSLGEYLKTGPLLLEFPKGENLHWVRLFAYMDVPEITYRGRKLLSLVEDSEDFGVVLVWEPRSKRIWFLDREHDVFHAVATWTKFIKNPGYYINRAVMWEFDD